MLTLFSRFRQFLTAQNSAIIFPKKNSDKKSPLLSGDGSGPYVSTRSKPRLPGEGRRSNRDRKSKPARNNAGDQCLANFTESDSIAAEKSMLEDEIRKAAEGLPEPIKHSYLTLLDTVLTHSDFDEQIERFRALHLAALDASRQTNGRSV